MSTMLLGACWPLDMSPVQKLVLISLADQANDEGLCWPSLRSIGQRTCISERAVRMALRWLESKKCIRSMFRSGHSTHYILTPAAYAPGKRCPRHIMPHSPAQDAPPMGHHMPPEPSVEPTKNHQVSKAVDIPDWIPGQAWADYVEMRARIRKPLTKRAIALGIAELERLKADGFSPQAVLEQSVFNAWQGLFPIKRNSVGASSTDAAWGQFRVCIRDGKGPLNGSVGVLGPIISKFGGLQTLGARSTWDLDRMRDEFDRTFTELSQ